MIGQLRRPRRWSEVYIWRVGFLTLLAISLSREKGTGGGAEAVNGCISSVVDMSLGPSVWRSCNAGNGEDADNGENTGNEEDADNGENTGNEEDTDNAGAAAIEGAVLGIRRLRRNKDGLFVKLRRNFVSRD